MGEELFPKFVIPQDYSNLEAFMKAYESQYLMKEGIFFIVFYFMVYGLVRLFVPAPPKLPK